jgi:hypothetical protein
MQGPERWNMTENCSANKTSEVYRLVHGWISIVLMGLIVATGSIAIFRENRLMPLAYLFFLSTGMVGVLYAFCTKCACKDSCRHIFLGPLSRLLPCREVAPYTIGDILMTVAGFSPMVVFPQYWLLKQKPLLVLFWQLTAALVVEITVFICRGCGNTHCPAKRPGK